MIQFQQQTQDAAQTSWARTHACQKWYLANHAIAQNTAHLLAYHRLANPASLRTLHTSLRCESMAKLVQESEGEDAAESRVTLAEDVGRGNLASRQSRVKLQEASLRVALLLPRPWSQALFFLGRFKSFNTDYCFRQANTCANTALVYQ